MADPWRMMMVQPCYVQTTPKAGIVSFSYKQWTWVFEGASENMFSLVWKQAQDTTVTVATHTPSPCGKLALTGVLSITTDEAHVNDLYKACCVAVYSAWQGCASGKCAAQVLLHAGDQTTAL
jgi:hypothetical protein